MMIMEKQCLTLKDQHTCSSWVSRKKSTFTLHVYGFFPVKFQFHLKHAIQ